MNTDRIDDELVDLWQSLDEGASPPRPVADIGRSRRMQRIQLATELAIAAAGTAVGVLFVASGALPVGVAAIAFSLFGGVVGWLTRSANVGLLDRSVAEHLAARTAILKARRNHDVAGVVMFLAAVVFFAVVRAHRDVSCGPVDVVVPLVLLALAVVYLRRALRRHRALAAEPRVVD